MSKSDFIELYTIETHSDGRFLHYIGWADFEEYEEPCGCFVPLGEILAKPFDRWDIVNEAAERTTLYGQTFWGAVEAGGMSEENWCRFIEDYITPPDGYERLALSQLTEDTPDGYYYWN